VARLFNAYVMVDWSANSKPKTGVDSIWIGVLKRDVRFQFGFESFNIGTRAEAEKRLTAILDDLKKRGEKTLLGFDFPLGLPRGTGAALKLKDEGWAGMWAFLAANVVDKADNTNNRFAVASKMNRLMTDEARPFWGSPPKDVQRWLTSTKPPVHGDDLPPVLRHAEVAAPGSKPVWQIFGNGTVGSQAIVGIPAVGRLKAARGAAVAIWPFETGWKPLTPADLEEIEVVAAEVYPSLVKAEPLPGEVKDLAQVRTLCQHFARLDEAGKLATAFGPAKDTAADVVLDVEREEGWILGA
jgi:hypothetical protein